MSTGTTYYIQNKHKAVVAVIPEDIKEIIDTLSKEIGCSRQEIYKDICQDFWDNRAKYSIDLKTWDKSITLYLPKKLHKNLSIFAMRADSSLKVLTSSILTSYFRDRSSIDKHKRFLSTYKGEAPKSCEI